MTDSTWAKVRRLLGENLDRFRTMPPSPPAPTAKWCRDSVHRALGHLTACQSAWLPIMRAIKEGEPRVVIPINPDPLFRKLGLGTTPWDALLARFTADRAEWSKILDSVDATREVQSTKRIHTAQSITRRLVEHEKRHLDQLDGKSK